MSYAKLKPIIKEYDWGREHWFGKIAEDKKVEELLEDIKLRGCCNSDDLDFSVKVLRAYSPLSIQVHPNNTISEKLFEEGILNSTIGKKETLYALTDSQLFLGFKNASIVVNNFETFLPRAFDILIKDKKHFFDRELNHSFVEEDKFFEEFMKHIYFSSDDTKKEILDEFYEVYQNNEKLKSIYEKTGYDYHFINDTKFNRDIFILAPLFLEYRELKAGEKVFIDYGVVHQIIEGFFIEVLTNSDNIFRLGLSSKEVNLGKSIEVIDYDLNCYRNSYSSMRIKENEILRIEKLNGYYHKFYNYADFTFFVNFDATGSFRMQDKDVPFYKDISLLVSGEIGDIRLKKFDGEIFSISFS